MRILHHTLTQRELRHAVSWRAVMIARALMVAVLLLTVAQPAAAITKEYQVKLAYLYKFALYVTWPDGEWAHSQDALVIGILGDDPFGAALDRVAEKRPDGKQVIVKHFASWNHYEPCDILFISRGIPPEALAGASKRIGNQPVLIVGDSLGPAFREAVFDFYLDAENRVGIKMNVDAAKRRRVRADARLLQVCDIVRDSEN